MKRVESNPVVRPVGTTLPRWLRCVVFSALVLAQALLVGQLPLVVLSLLGLGALIAFRPEMIRSDLGWPNGLRRALRMGRALPPAGWDCLWLVAAAVPVGLAAGVLDLPSWLITLLVSAAATAALTARLSKRSGQRVLEGSLTRYPAQHAPLARRQPANPREQSPRQTGTAPS